MVKFNWLHKRPTGHSTSEAEQQAMRTVPDQLMDSYRLEAITGSVSETTDFISKILDENDDFKLRNFRILNGQRAAICYLSSLTSETVINIEILKPLMNAAPPASENHSPQALQDYLSEQVLYQSTIRLESRLVELVEAILRGHVVVIIEQLEVAYILGSRHIAKRSIDQPETEQVVQGPREGFIESLDTNLALIRYRLPTPDLRIKTMTIGRLTKSKVAVCYIEGIVHPPLVDEVINRLSKIDTDAILDAGYLEQYIQDNEYSPFPQVQNTERPDKAVANLVEGRVIVLVDGSPFGLIAPSVFSQFYQTAEDYSSRSLQGSFVRLARLAALVFSLIFPALYVAIISFNPELIPTEFAVAVAGGRAGVPFPSVIEVLIMEISMEVLREATIRLPQQVGGALSIVGVLVIGQAAVSAGFASPITVVVIALTTIGSFATPAYTAAFALRMLRFPLLILSGMFGLYGLMIGLILISNHMLSLRSFGAPYLTPAVPGDAEGIKDLVFRLPLWTLRKRPSLLHTRNRLRVGDETLRGQQIKKNVLDDNMVQQRSQHPSKEE